MGKKFAPAFANLYMCFWEETVFVKCQTLPSLYLRYLDDIFGIWVNSMREFECFLESLNTHHPAITISHNIQREKLEFLDTQVFFVPSEGQTKSLATKVFFKETDRHALLHKASYHPKHTFRGIIKSQLIRFNRICTLGEHVEEATTILFGALGPRGYSKRFLREIKAEVGELFGREEGYNKTAETHNLIPFVATYSGSLGGLSRTLRSNFREAQQAVEGLLNCRIISAYRKNKNLGDKLVHSAFRQKEVPNKLEKYLERPKYITNAFSGLGFPIRQRIELSTTNLIYVIKCKLCQKMYIGETKNALQARLKQHLYNMAKGNKSTGLYLHFSLHASDNLKIFGLETNGGWSRKQRQGMERIWIGRLQTIDPKGLNEKY